MHEVGLDQVSVGQLIPTVLSNLDPGFRGRAHEAKFSIDVCFLFHICERVPGSSKVSSSPTGTLVQIRGAYQALRWALVVQVLLVAARCSKGAGDAAQSLSDAMSAATKKLILAMAKKRWLTNECLGEFQRLRGFRKKSLKTVPGHDTTKDDKQSRRTREVC